MTKYIRLLSYQDALRVISFAEDIDIDIDNTTAYITTGGVALNGLTHESLHEITEYLNYLEVRYEISDKHPTQATYRHDRKTTISND